MAARIQVLYFAAVRDLAGTAEESVELPAHVRCVAELVPFLEERRPELRGRLGSVRLAVNEDFAEPASTVGDGDVIALIPPVAGG